MTIPLDILTASGHPYPNGVAPAWNRLKVMQGVDGNKEGSDMGLPFDEPTRLTNIRRLLLRVLVRQLGRGPSLRPVRLPGLGIQDGA